MSKPSHRFRKYLAVPTGLLLSTSLVVGSAPAFATSAEDTAPPAIGSVVSTPDRIDLSRGPVEVAVRFRITDETGVRAPHYLRAETPKGTSIEFEDLELVEGDVRQGTWTATARIPAYAEEGTWTMWLSDLTDLEGNTIGDLKIGTFDVSGASHPYAPKVEERSVTPGDIDVSEQAAQIDIKARVTDPDPEKLHLTVRHESGQVAYRGHMDVVDEWSTEWALQADLEAQVSIPTTAALGTWTVELSYGSTLQTGYGGSTVHTAKLGTFDVSGNTSTDLEVPDLVDYTVTPAEADVKDQPATVTARTQIRDATGVLPPSVSFIGSDTYEQSPMELVEGTERDGIWEASTVVPAGSDAGTLTVELWALEDLLGWRDPESLTPNFEPMTLGTVTVVNSDKPEAVPEVKFSDVSEGQWFFSPVMWMVDHEITTGYKDGTFKPYNPVTRGEAVTFLYRYAGEDFTAPEQSELTDVPPTHNFFEAITWATENGVVNGYTDDSFRSGHNMTRGQVAAILYRQADAEHTAPEESPFTDLTPQSNQYEAITWLAENDITTGRTDGTFDPYANVTRAELATFLQRYNNVLTQ